jgi:site-specific recombinase XerD
MGELRERMREEMKLRGLRPSTIKAYLASIRGFVRFHGLSPVDLGKEEIRKYLLHLLEERKLSRSTVNQILCGLRFLYCDVLQTPEKVAGFHFPRQRGKKLPVVLSQAEVLRLFEAAHEPIYRTLFMTLYAAGLRIGEACRLKISDIDPDRMQILIRDAKGGKDRQVILSRRLLEALRSHWRQYRPKVWLFCGRGKEEKPLPLRRAQRAFQRARREAKINKAATPHSLRHSFATHLLEQGANIRYIQQLLGHKSVQTTLIYTQFTGEHVLQIRSPLDTLPQSETGSPW